MSYFWQFLKRARILKFNTSLRSKSSVEFENLILKEIQIVFLGENISKFRISGVKNGQFWSSIPVGFEIDLWKKSFSRKTQI